MKNLIYLILFTGIVVHAQAQNKFQRKYLVRDSIYYSMLKSVELNNGSFLTLTSHNNLGATAPQLHVMNCFPNGTTNWYKKHDCVGFMDFTDFTLHSNNQIGVSGVYNFSDPVYILLDSSGNILSTTEYTFSSYASFNGIFSNGSNHNVMMGYLSQFNKGIIVETDLSGNVHRADEYEINNHPVVFNTGLLLRNDNRLFTGPVSMNLGTHQQKPGWGTCDWSFRKSIVGFANRRFFFHDEYTFCDGTPGSIHSDRGCSNQQVPFFASILIWLKWIQMAVLHGWMCIRHLIFLQCIALRLRWIRTLFWQDTIFHHQVLKQLYVHPDSGGHVLFTRRIQNRFSVWMELTLQPAAMVQFWLPQKHRMAMDSTPHICWKTDSTFHGVCNESSLNVSELNLITYDSTGFTQQTSNVSAAAFSLNNFSSSMITPIESDPCLPNGLDELKENSSFTCIRWKRYPVHSLLRYKFRKSGFYFVWFIGKAITKFFRPKSIGRKLIWKEIGHPTKGIYFLQCNSGEENLSRLILIAY